MLVVLLGVGSLVGAAAKQLNVPRLASAPVMEDFLVSEPVTEMARVAGFIQNQPYDGDPASRDTVAYLGYDDEHFYVVFVAYDDADKIRARLSPRENVWSDDTVAVTLDTFHDQRRAYIFRTNPLGVQQDRFFVEGQGSDGSYDTIWASAGQLTDWGYVVWMALPFKSLRFAPGGDQPWGVILERRIERLHETSTWPRVSSRIEGTLNQAAVATGIRQVSPGQNFQVIPYSTSTVSSGIEEQNVPVFIDDEFETKVGVDIKKTWNDNLVTDLTINPDFSQVESDRPQVTINRRFEVFFPERRPFFLENADVFRTPINLLFTRRIVDPEIGGRITGKLGRWAIGSFLIDDEAPGKTLPSDDPDHGKSALFGTLRVNRDIGEQSRLGAMYVQRDFADERNRVASMDGRFKWNDHWVATAQGVGSWSEYPNLSDTSGNAALLAIRREGREFNYDARVNSISADFEAAAGFIHRTGIISMSHFAGYSWWPKNGGPLVRWDTGLGIGRVWDQSGDRLDDNIKASVEWEFPFQTEFEIVARYGTERLTTAEFPDLAADRDYDRNSIELEYETSWWKSFSIRGETRLGKAINFEPVNGNGPESADMLQTNLNFTFRPLTQLAIDTSLIYTLLENAASGARVLKDAIGRTRLNWQFTRALSLRAIVQYEHTSPNPLETTITDRENWNVDFLLTYRVNPWTAVYFGYNTNRQNIDIVDQGGVPTLIRTSGLHKDSEQWLLKFSYLMRR